MTAIHDPSVYDLAVDTTLLAPYQCALQIKERLQEGPPPTAWRWLKVWGNRPSIEGGSAVVRTSNRPPNIQTNWINAQAWPYDAMARVAVMPRIDASTIIRLTATAHQRAWRLVVATDDTLAPVAPPPTDQRSSAKSGSRSDRPRMAPVGERMGNHLHRCGCFW